MSRVRVIALGSALHRDDGVALVAAKALDDSGLDVRLAGRPGPGLLDMLDPSVPTLVLDAVRGVEPGTLVELTLDEVAREAAVRTSSHGLGVAEALQLGFALGRALPRGRFIGLGGARFDPGEGLSPAVAARADVYVDAIRAAASSLS